MALGMPPRVTQRSQTCRSSQVSSPRGRPVMAASPADVSGGNLPFGGSTSSDVRSVGVPRSIQKLLYAPTFPPATVSRRSASRSCDRARPPRFGVERFPHRSASSDPDTRRVGLHRNDPGRMPDAPADPGRPRACAAALADCAAASAGMSASAAIVNHAAARDGNLILDSPDYSACPVWNTLMMDPEVAECKGSRASPRISPLPVAAVPSLRQRGSRLPGSSSSRSPTLTTSNPPHPALHSVAGSGPRPSAKARSSARAPPASSPGMP